MVDHEKERPSTSNMSLKKQELLSSALKRTSEWIFSQEIPSDVTVHIGEAAFSLHKFPLVSRSGYIRKLVSESSESDISVIDLPDIPGGVESFELAAKFCYGINFEINIENIAMLRCVAEYLEMTEDYCVGNLIEKTEAYINEVALKNIASAVSVLHTSESLLPTAERVKLVSRCIDAIAYIACKENESCTSGRGENSLLVEGVTVTPLQPRPIVDWWAEDLTILRIDIFQRVLIAMMARGFKQYALGPILMLYAQKSLRGLEMLGKGRKKIEPQQEHEKRVVLETVVSLLPKEKNAMSVSFLSMLLRAAIHLETTVACRLDLEKRMGLQLGQAVIDDLLIPSYLFTGETLFDVDTVQRITTNYLDSEFGISRLSNSRDDHEYVSPPQNDIERVGKLMENYLAEISSDRNLPVTKFISLAELIPEQSRVTEDGMYRAIDIYLKAHPALSEVERKSVCSMMDCQKLSREACAHAAKNDRLPVQTVVQVLYHEQQRLRDAMNNGDHEDPPFIKSKLSLASNTEHVNRAADELSVLKRENQDLKLELVKLKMKMKEMERNVIQSTTSSPLVNKAPSADKPPLPKKSFMNSVSKKLGRLAPLLRSDGSTPPKTRTKPSKDRRHSIS